MPRVAIIGAGVCGLTAIKACLEEGLQPVCFEQYDHAGGLWAYSDDVKEGQGASVYASLITNVSKEMSSFSDFPFPAEQTPYLIPCQMYEYLMAYAAHFKLLAHVNFNTKILKIEKAADYEEKGRWTITYCDNFKGVTEKERKETFDAVMVGSGFFHAPFTPSIPGLGEFEGEVSHSITYRRPEKFKGKTVLVVGNAHSAGDIAVDASRVAKKVYLSVGRGTWVVQRLAQGGLPRDMTQTRFNLYCVPSWFYKREHFRRLETRINHTNFGLKPNYGQLTPAFMVNDDIGLRILSGRITVKAGVKRFTQAQAELQDGGTIDDIDHVVFATGFKMECDFLDESLLKGPSGELELYRIMWPIHLQHPTMAIMGMTRVGGSVLPVAELQARWAARVMAGKLNLPRYPDMKKEVHNTIDRIKKNTGYYVPKVEGPVYRDVIAIELGVQPSFLRLLFTDPRLAFNFFFCPPSPFHHRLVGPHTWPDARSAALAVYKNTINATKTRLVEEPPANQRSARSRSLVVMATIGVGGVIVYVVWRDPNIYHEALSKISSFYNGLSNFSM